MVCSDWQSRHLIAALLRRKIAARYRGTWLGGLWMVLQPLAMVAVFTLIFDRFLKVRWPTAGAGEDTALDAAINIYLGVLVLNYAAENLTCAPSSILEHPQYVTKIVFPLPVLGMVNALAALMPLVAGLLVIAWFAAVSPKAHLGDLWLLPLYLAPLVLWGVALQWLLGALGVYLRDLAQIAPALTLLLMFLSPVFYSLKTVPEPWQVWLTLNPLTLPIEAARALVYGQGLPAMTSLLGEWLAASLAAGFSRYAFERLRSGFADVL